MAGEITFPGSKVRGEPRSGACEPPLNLAFITSKQKVLKECPLWLILPSKTWKNKHIFLSLLAGSQAIFSLCLRHRALQSRHSFVWYSTGPTISRQGQNSDFTSHEIYDSGPFISAFWASVSFSIKWACCSLHRVVIRSNEGTNMDILGAKQLLNKL